MTKDEIKMFHEKSASGLCIRVYYSTTQLMIENEDFPSIKSIAERMGYDLTQNYTQTIGKALRWLRSEGLIEHSQLATRQSEVKSGIYQIKTEKGVYVGQSKQIDKRWKDHERSIKNNLHRYIKSNDVFKFSILEECRIQDLHTKELLWANKIHSDGETVLNKANFTFITENK